MSGEHVSGRRWCLFSLLARDRGDRIPELTDVRRFRAEWEKKASTELRLGRASAINIYEAHDRITEGDREHVLDALYSAWKADVDAGKSSLMIAADTATVVDLNRRARADRVVSGTVAENGLRLAGGEHVGVGDEVVTRQNDRQLTLGRGWVKNGDRFVVTATADGTMSLRRASGSEVVLPADCVAAYVELAYATTAHRAQGRTVDTAHALLSPTTTREVLCVSATRGRDSNRLYVDTHYDPDPATGHDGTSDPQSARDVLHGVLANEGADVSAHETMRRPQHQAEDFATLAAEYETLATAAQAGRWAALLARSGLSTGEVPWCDRATHTDRSSRHCETARPAGSTSRQASRCSLEQGHSPPRTIPPQSSMNAWIVGCRHPHRSVRRPTT